MKIYLDERELTDGFAESQGTDDAFALDESTSVSRLKADLFRALAQIGELCPYSSQDAASNDRIAGALREGGTILASFHESPPDVPCRLLQHTKGGLMLPGGMLNRWTFHGDISQVCEGDRIKESQHVACT